MRKLILDTDIGSDVDDALALAMLLGSEKINLLGITTVYGDTRLRAQIARHLCEITRREIPIYAGAKTPLSGREVWVSGNEGTALGDLSKYKISDASAIQFLLDYIESSPQDVEILAIGPLTNIARAIQESSSFVENLKHLWIMGGNFSQNKIEHNFKSDSVAAKIVLESKIPITILDLPASQKTRLRNTDIDKIKKSGILGPILYEEIIRWIQPRNQDWTTPHDPIAGLALIQPELFEFSNSGDVRIGVEGESVWNENSHGNVRKISPINPEVAVDSFIELISKVN